MKIAVCISSVPDTTSKINFTENNNFKLILVGCVTVILVQTFIHVGVNIRIFPTTGMTMPFLSYGGSFIISTMVCVGILQSVYIRREVTASEHRLSDLF